MNAREVINNGRRLKRHLPALIRADHALFKFHLCELDDQNCILGSETYHYNQTDLRVHTKVVATQQQTDERSTQSNRNGK